MATEKNLLDFPTTTDALSADWIHISQGGVDKKISLADFITDLNGGNPFNITVKEETAGNRILTIADKNAYIRCLNGTQTTIQVKNAATVGWKKGDSIIFRKEGLGNVLVAGDSGVTIKGAASGNSLTETGQAGQLICIDDTPEATIFDFVTGGNARATVNGSVTFLTVAGMVSGSTNEGNTVDFSELAANNAKVSTVWNNTTSRKGGADYVIWTLSDYRTFIGDGGWTPDGDVVTFVGGDHYVGGGATYVAIMNYSEKTSNFYQFGTYDTYIAYLGDNKILRVSDGIKTGSIQVDGNNVVGTSYAAILEPDGGAQALLLERHITSPEHDWTKPVIDMMTIRGDGTLVESGINFGADPFSGGYLVSSTSFVNLDKGIEKPSGNIGNIYYNLAWRNVNFGIHASSDPNPMHSGADTTIGSHWDGVDKACYYINDNIDGSGGWVVRDSIAEQCDGFFLFGDFGNRTPYTPPVLENVWLEAVAKSATTTIDSVVYDTRELYIKDCPVFRLRDMQLNSAEIINSVVHGDCIRIDDAIVTPDFLVDDDSQLVIDNLYSDGVVTGVPFVRSILRQESDSNTKNLSVRGPLKTQAIPYANVSNGTLVAGNSYNDLTTPSLSNFVGTVTLTPTKVTDGVLFPDCAELTVATGRTELSTQAGTPTSGKWVVWSIHAKLMSGSFTSASVGNNMTLGEIYLKTGKWVCSYGIQKTNTVGTARIQLINNTGSSATIRLADFWIMEFDNFSDAVEFVNSGYSLDIPV